MMLIEKKIFHKFTDRIHTWRWVVPLATVVIVVLYEFGPARWLHQQFGDQFHFIAEILFYGTLGPMMTFLLLDFLSRWLEERQTSELQAYVLEHAREQVEISRGLSDDALQALFAASTLMASLKHSADDLSPETTSALRGTERALDHAIQELRTHLQDQKLPNGVIKNAARVKAPTE